MPEQNTLSKPLTFGELAIGKRFIGFPVDGDDSGHGGFRKSSFIFIKTGEAKSARTIGDTLANNAIRLFDGTPSNFPDDMKILRVE